MSKNVVVISTSLRNGSNSEVLADSFLLGAQAQGHIVEKITLNKKKIEFCVGCLACQKEGVCIFKDDVQAIIEKIQQADVVVFATPIYFYEMAGQMKVLLDRTNPLFPVEYKFRDIYLLASAADDDKSAIDGAVKGLKGWIECFDEVQLKGVLCATNMEESGEIQGNEIVDEAYKMGQAC